MIPRLRRALVAALILAPLPTAAFAQRQLTPITGGAELRNGSVAVRVTAITDEILRVRIGRGTLPEDASWAVSDAMRRKSVPVRATANGFATRSVAVSVDPQTLQISIADVQGRPILGDD